MDSKKINNIQKMNVFSVFSGISLSLFSLSIASVFSETPEIISISWLFEATLLYYFYHTFSNEKMYSQIRKYMFFAANVLFVF
jgi:hypothetical protein